MKKFLSSLLGLALCLSLATPAALADGPWNGRTAAPSQMWTSLTLGMNNFRRVRDYAPGPAVTEVVKGEGHGSKELAGHSCLRHPVRP